MAGSTRKIVALAMVVVLGMVALTPVVSAINDNTGKVSVSNDTVQADHGNWTDLEGFDLDKSTLSVEDTSGTTTYSEGSDYEVAVANGSIKALSSGTISDGETLNATYDYQATAGSTTTLLGFIPVMVGLLMFVAVANGVRSEMAE